MNRARMERHREHLKVHERLHAECEQCQDRLDMCFEGEDRVYGEHDSDCVRCGC